MIGQNWVGIFGSIGYGDRLNNFKKAVESQNL